MYQISRCKGYTCSLLRAILAQRRALMLALRNYKLLKYIGSFKNTIIVDVCNWLHHHIEILEVLERIEVYY